MKWMAPTALAIMTVFGIAVPATASTLRWIEEYPQHSIAGEADQRLAESVGPRLGSRLIQILYETDNPFRGAAQLEAVASGKVEIGSIFVGALEEDPFFKLPILPFVCSSVSDAKH